EKGVFSVRVKNENSVLVFSSVGMVTREITVGNRTNINVELKSGTQNLGEIVVVGYGTQKRANLTGSVAVIETGDLASRPFSSTTNALQGVAPGVTVKNPTGAPGSEGTIRIRGIGTLNNSNPLVLVDGV